MTPCKGLDATFATQVSDKELKFWRTGADHLNIHASPRVENDIEDASKSAMDILGGEVESDHSEGGEDEKNVPNGANGNGENYI